MDTFENLKGSEAPQKGDVLICQSCASLCQLDIYLNLTVVELDDLKISSTLRNSLAQAQKETYQQVLLDNEADRKAIQKMDEEIAAMAAAN